MFKKWSYALICLAICLTTGHNLVAHDHHQVMEVECDGHTDDQDDDHDGHTFFSYGHIEESFVSRSNAIDLKNDHFVSVCIVPAPVALTQNFSCTEITYAGFDLFPPGKALSLNISQRGPPAIIG